MFKLIKLFIKYLIKHRIYKKIYYTQLNNFFLQPVIGLVGDGVPHEAEVLQLFHPGQHFDVGELSDVTIGQVQALQVGDVRCYAVVQPTVVRK